MELHVDAMQDVAAVVRVNGQDQAALSDLSRTLGGAVAAGRLQAQASGDRSLAELLDAARRASGGRPLLAGAGGARGHAGALVRWVRRRREGAAVRGEETCAAMLDAWRDFRSAVERTAGGKNG